MPNLIDSSYFLREEIKIPNILDSTDVAQKVEQFIAIHEPRYLKELFGYDFYKLFIAGVAATEQRFEDIRDGVDYTDSYGRGNHWNGLLDLSSGQNVSPIANYVYYHFERSIASQSTGIGEVETLPNGSKPASAAEKMVQAWNEMVKYSREFRNFMYAPSSASLYPEWSTMMPYGYSEIYKPINLFNF